MKNEGLAKGQDKISGFVVLLLELMPKGRMRCERVQGFKGLKVQSLKLKRTVGIDGRLLLNTQSLANT
ncbi:MAG: hypothetical protein IPH20_25515 [Bacteroidales bacterium]|nr:hypothetical protein [Bacteroidales bacterium]